MRYGISRILRQAFVSESAMPMEQTRAIIRLTALHRWFQQQRGRTMQERKCETCATLRIFTIWTDGCYHCLFCLLRQAGKSEEGPIALETPAKVSREFQQMWLSYRRCSQDLDAPGTCVFPEDGWMLNVESSSPQVSVAKPPMCLAEGCAACKSIRPHVLGAGDIKHCFHCLMKRGLQAAAPAVHKRPTVERLDAVAAAAVASLRSQSAAL